MQVTEEVDFEKEMTIQARRDLRPGKQIARAAKISHGFYVEMSWGAPLPGRLSETYVRRGDSLHVESEVTMQGAQELTHVVSLHSCCTHCPNTTIGMMPCHPLYCRFTGGELNGVQDSAFPRD